MHGMEGGETGLDDDIAASWNTNIGATIMGRNMFGPVRGDWGDQSWRGWWGADPPFHTPVFVLTNHPREPLEMKGGTTFHFVTDGKDVSLGGGARVAQQYLQAGLIDEMHLHVVPMILGAGSRLFDNLDGGPVGYECIDLVSSAAVTHYTYMRKDRA